MRLSVAEVPAPAVPSKIQEYAVEGKGISVDFDGRQLVIRSKNALVAEAFGTDRLVLDLGIISAASLHPAGLLSDGWLDITTNDNRRFQFRFMRKQQPAFKDLYQSALADRIGVPAAAGTAPVPTVRGTGYCGQQVVGESHYLRALRKLSGPRWTGERDIVAVVRREPHNRHDRNAVRVTIDGQVVGYLPREDAEAYQAPLLILEEQGRPAICGARLWWSRERDSFMASVSLDLADPASLVPVNSPDASARHLVLPAGRAIQVTKENEHLDALVPVIRRAYVPGKVAVYGSLHRVERTGPRSVSQVVTVHIDGREIGELTKQSSAKLIPVLRPMEAAAIGCYAEVVLTGNALAVEAKLHITPPEELPPAFLEQLHRALNR